MLTGKTMGTTYHIKYQGKTKNLAIIVEQYLGQFEQVFSSYVPTSELSLINQAPTNTWLKTSDELSKLLLLSAKINQKTNGFFDIALGNALSNWGFYGRTPQAKPEINGMEFINIKPNLINKQQAVLLDLSAIAKGYAIDNLARLLKQQGITNFLIEIGGEIYASGKKSKHQFWQVRVDNTNKTIKLHNQAIATSGNNYNFVSKNNKKYGHILNPKTTQSVNDDLLSISVIHPSTTIADAYATALMAMDRKSATNFINTYNLEVISTRR